MSSHDSASLDRARALVATSVSRAATEPTLGAIVLRPDQVETVRRAREELRREGGCLLADDVGTGKTYVALAVARAWTDPLVVAPASLRTTWEHAARRANVPCRFTSHEALSRGRRIDGTFGGIVVDESHRFRPASRRHAALAELAARAPVLMLSATPLQNRVRELAAQLALFLGEIAYRLPPARLARWIVRSATNESLPLPRVAAPRWLPIVTDDGDVLRAILALPPPPRAADAGDGGVLLLLSLVRAWASSRTALVGAVRRRQRTLAAIEQCHHEGRLPTRRELRSWEGGGDVQLGFPSLLATSEMDEVRRAALTRAITCERSALDALLQTIGRGSDPDPVRVAALRTVRRAHAGASVLAFSEWASTVHAYWTALRAERGVGLLTAHEARIASGRITRHELLARFAPRAQEARAPAAHERVTLLLATDLLSEGVNLQDASVVVHLDLPWNPARLAQRLGRIRRPGGASEVASYLMSPPARAALLLRAESRLRAKLQRAERIVGHSVDVLPALGALARPDDEASASERQHGVATVSLSTAELHGEIARRLARWREQHACVDVEPHSRGDPDVVIAAVRAPVPGWIAVLDDGRLVAAFARDDGPHAPSDAPELILRALELAAGPPCPPSDLACDAARRALDEWIAHDWSQRSCGLEAADTPLRRRVLHALDDALGTTPRHRRAAMLVAAGRLRRALMRPLPLGVERALAALVAMAPLRAEWIADADALVAGAPHAARASAWNEPPRCRAVILLAPQSTSSDGRRHGEDSRSAVLATPITR